MLVLALDTATSAMIAGLVRLAPAHEPAGAPQVVAERATETTRAHAELLMPSVRGMLASAGVPMRDLDAVVCGAGPGPFTGLRVGMVTAAALGDALDIPVYPVVSLDAIAHRAGGDSPLLVITDARRREVYWARYDCDPGKGCVRVDGPHVGRPDELPLEGVARVAGAAERLTCPARPPVVPPRHPDPAALAALAAARVRSHAPPAPLTPLYLRRPDAEEPGPRKLVIPA
ncbi:MAG TPA: tRNA (adenosine(37)-N6)-threonylcarbamoyltransferase complex dimerization subunit type 1 TsaB [Pseudonocardiaceae bacterium]|nr:tRNA (adenosine(37)-N6)-threonylcarbamoyltransferase complex dimerization subunit type 1 TsaB [Pseudonocardiaceae bacterium]